MRSFQNQFAVRHNRLVDTSVFDPRRSGDSFQTRLPSRPARLIFEGIEGDPLPRTKELTELMDATDGVYAPTLYRGRVMAEPEENETVAVRLWEEPSGRALNAELTWDWFDRPPWKGMPFRLMLWLTLDEHGKEEPRHRLECAWKAPDFADDDGEEGDESA